MPKFWVSYAVVDNTVGAQSATGACEVELSGLPASIDEVSRVADTITDRYRSAGKLTRDQWAVVLGWSEMGG